MRIHVLGVGSIGSLVAHHIRRQFPRQPLSLILHRRGLPENPSSASDKNSSGKSDEEDFRISVERDGQLSTTTDFSIEYIGPGLTKAHEDIARLGSYSTGSRSLPLLRKKQALALSRISTARTPDEPIDSLIVALKCGDTVPALRLLRHRITEKTCVTLLQNGMGVHDELLREIWPRGRGRDGDGDGVGVGTGTGPRFVLGSTTHGVKTVLQSKSRNTGRKVRHEGFGEVKFGVVPASSEGEGEEGALFPDLYSSSSAMGSPYETILHPPPSPALPISLPHPNLSKTLSLLLSLSDLSPTLLPFHLMHQTLLLKLAINSTINPLTALFRVKNGTLATDEGMKDLIRSLSGEHSSVILGHLGELAAGNDERARWFSRPAPISPASSSSRLETPVDPDLHPPILSPEITALFSPESLYRRTLEVARMTRGNISSMSNHLTRGAGETEVDYINGYMVKLGHGREYDPTAGAGAGAGEGHRGTGMNRALWRMIKAATTLSRSRTARSSRERKRTGNKPLSNAEQKEGDQTPGVQGATAKRREEWVKRHQQGERDKSRPRGRARRAGVGSVGQEEVGRKDDEIRAWIGSSSKNAKEEQRNEQAVRPIRVDAGLDHRPDDNGR